MPLLLGVLVLVLIEISLFVTVGGAIGLLPTLLIILGTGVAGGMVLRAQGQKALAHMAETVRDPRETLAAAGDGTLMALAGILLILPGFLGDSFGLLLLVPPVRGMILGRLATRVQAQPGMMSMHVVVRGGRGRSTRIDGVEDADIIDAEVLDLPPEDPHVGRPHR